MNAMLNINNLHSEISIFQLPHSRNLSELQREMLTLYTIYNFRLLNANNFAFIMTEVEALCLTLVRGATIINYSCSHSEAVQKQFGNGSKFYEEKSFNRKELRPFSNSKWLSIELWRGDKVWRRETEWRKKYKSLKRSFLALHNNIYLILLHDKFAVRRARKEEEKLGVGGTPRTSQLNNPLQPARRTRKSTIWKVIKWSFKTSVDLSLGSFAPLSPSSLYYISFSLCSAIKFLFSFSNLMRSNHETNLMD